MCLNDANLHEFTFARVVPHVTLTFAMVVRPHNIIRYTREGTLPGYKREAGV